MAGEARTAGDGWLLLEVVAEVVALLVALVVLVVLGAVGGLALGCDAPTIGGGAGRENDPCRDAGGPTVAGIVLGLGLWAIGVALVRRRLLRRWARPT